MLKTLSVITERDGAKVLNSSSMSMRKMILGALFSHLCAHKTIPAEV